jgi:chromosome segregation ATPase
MEEKKEQMQLNIRKATHLQNSIKRHIDAIHLDFAKEVGTEDDIVKTLEAANETLFKTDERRNKLLTIYYNIAALIAQANAGCGITTAQAKIGFVDNRITQVEQIAKAVPLTDPKALEGYLKEVTGSVSTGVVSLDQIKQAKAELQNLKINRQQLEEEIFELMVKTEIPLTDDNVTILGQEGLI